MRPDWESNWQPFGSQAHAQSTEPHQPGLDQDFLSTALLAFWAGWMILWGGGCGRCLRIIAGLAAPLASTHWMPVAPSQLSPDVPWGVKLALLGTTGLDNIIACNF